MVYANLRYQQGSMVDATGHRWHRSQAWLEPDDVRDLVEQNVPFLVQYCRERPRRERAERFKRDIALRLLTRAQADAVRNNNNSVPTVMIAELWSGRSGEPAMVLFVEGPPGQRSISELVDDS